MNLAFLSSMVMLTAGNLVSDVFEVFGLIADWFVESIPKLFVLFYSSESGITLLGIMALVSIGVGVFFLLAGFVQNFFKLRS